MKAGLPRSDTKMKTLLHGGAVSRVGIRALSHAFASQAVGVKPPKYCGKSLRNF